MRLVAIHYPIVLLVVFVRVSARQDYAEPLPLPGKQNAPFVFEMNIEWRLTMSYFDDNKLVELLDYYPHEEQWYIRNKDLAMACGLKAPLANSSRLRDIVQMHGLHQHVITINGERSDFVLPIDADFIV